MAQPGTVTITSGGVTLGHLAHQPGYRNSNHHHHCVASRFWTQLPLSYGGDSNNNPANGTTTQTVTKALPVVSPTSSVNPSTVGQSVTLYSNRNVRRNRNSDIFTSGTTVLVTSTLTGGTATATTSALPAGSDPIAAAYNGDGNYNSATGTLTQVVNKTTPAISVTTSGPSTYGGTVTITTTLPPGTTGTVTITSGGVTLGSGPVNSTTGAVTITTTVLPVGTDTITASYGGDTEQ